MRQEGEKSIVIEIIIKYPVKYGLYRACRKVVGEMKALSSAAMKEADRKTIEELGMPGAVLMETAAVRTVELIRHKLPRAKRFTVLAGPGNNGGDGLAIARLLKNAGLTGSLWSTVKPGGYRGDAGINEQFMERTDGPINRLEESGNLDRFREEIKHADFLVDALLGIGAGRDVEGLFAELVESVNELGLPVVAVDIPSGVNGDTGAVMGCAVQADWTVTFAYPKLGLFGNGGAEKAGEVYVGQINIPSVLVENEPVDLLTPGQIQDLLPSWNKSVHKGSLGRVLVVAGSPGMTGAAVLAGESALMGGAGLAYLAVPRSLEPVVSARLVEVITISLEEAAPGIVSSAASGTILERAGNCDALAIGPGLDPGSDAAELLKQVIAASPVPMVIDAGALEALKGRMELLKEAKQPVVITPHPGEMARLAGLTVREVQENRLEIAVDHARRWGVFLVLKGFNTIIAAPDGKAAINPAGGPALATAGSGDLLTGLIASFIAQGLETENAARAGAFIHGLAGDLVPGGRGHMAREVMYHYKQAFQGLKEAEALRLINPYLAGVRGY